MKNSFYFVLFTLLLSISSMNALRPQNRRMSSSGDAFQQSPPLWRGELQNDLWRGELQNDLERSLNEEFGEQPQLQLLPEQLLAETSPLRHPTPLYGRVRRTQDLERLHERGRHHPYGTPQGRRSIFDRRIVGAAVRDAAEQAGVGPARRLNLDLDTQGVPVDLVSPHIVSAIVDDEPTNRLLRTIADHASPRHTPLPPSLPDLGHLGGDERGGGHRLSPSEYARRVETPTQALHGTSPLTHPHTGVWTGRYRPTDFQGEATYKTGFPSANTLTDQQLNALHHRPTRILGRSNGRTLERWEYNPPSSPETTQELFVERIQHPERYVDTTFYPIWDHQRYDAESGSDMTIPEVGTYSPTEILNHAKQLLDTHDESSSNQNPARYISRRNVTVDIAPALGSPLIKKGIYVTFPKGEFTDEQLGL